MRSPESGPLWAKFVIGVPTGTTVGALSYVEIGVEADGARAGHQCLLSYESNMSPSLVLQAFCPADGAVVLQINNTTVTPFTAGQDYEFTVNVEP